MDTITQSRVLDSNCSYFGLSALQLMESAGRAVAEQLKKDFGSNLNIAVFCGTGNNGGDGFTAARYLAKENSVTVHLIGKEESISRSEAYRNFLVLKNSNVKVLQHSDSKELPKRVNADIVVECLLSVGAKGKLREPIASAVKLLNKARAKKISVDLPCPGFDPGIVYCLAMKKHPAGITLDIGIPTEFYNFAGPGNVKFLRERKAKSHKGENGSILVIAGSRKFHGAAVFAAKAASLFSDLVYVLTEKENIPALKKAGAEFIVSELNKKNAREFAQKADAVLVGPGLAVNKKNRALLGWLLKEFPRKKFVLDAGALHLLGAKKLHKNCILTPHSGEFKKVVGANASPREVFRRAKELGCLVLLKGPMDVLSDGFSLYYNFSGNALLTAGGTGDVLAGLIAAFAAKNDLLDAALAAAFLNGFAADLIGVEKSALNSGTLLDEIPRAAKLCSELY